MAANNGPDEINMAEMTTTAGLGVTAGAGFITRRTVIDTGPIAACRHCSRWMSSFLFVTRTKTLQSNDGAVHSVIDKPNSRATNWTHAIHACDQKSFYTAICSKEAKVSAV